MKIRLSLLALIMLFLACNQSEKSKSKNESVKEEISISLIDSLLQAEFENHKFMGTIAINRKGETLYSIATGYDDIESQKKSKVSSKYRIGSISKNFTAVLILKAVEEGKIKLDQSIDEFYPKIENANSISIKNLLNHSSGLHSYTNDKAFRQYHTKGKTTEEMLQIIYDYQSDFAPGSKSEYSNSNYFILSLILEKIYDMDYGEIIISKICLPLSLENTYYGGSTRLDSNETYSYNYTNNWIKLPETELSVVKGAGGIVSTSSDLNKYFESLFSGQIVSQKSLEKMLTMENSFGLGFEKYSYNDRICFGHGGKIDGFSSLALHFPNENMTISILANSNYENFTDLVKKIVNVFFQTKVIEILEAELIKYTGKYQSQNEKEFIAEFEKDGNTLIHIIKGEFRAPLIYKGDRKFVLEQGSLEPMIFTFTQDGGKMLLEQGKYKDECVKIVDDKRK